MHWFWDLPASIWTCLKTAKIDRIVTVDEAQLTAYDPDFYLPAIKAILDRQSSSLIVGGHTTQGMDFMPRLAALLRRPLAAGCVNYEKVGDRLVLTRQVFNAKMNLKVVSKGQGPTLVTIVPGSFPGDEIETGGAPEVEAISVDLTQVKPGVACWASPELPRAMWT